MILRNWSQFERKQIQDKKQIPKPTNAKEIMQWLGFTGYYRRFVKNYAQITRPLSKLLRKGEKFVWGEEQEFLFEKLKDLLCNEPVLAAPVLSKHFIVTIDTSDYAVGAVLSQGEIDKDHPYPYA